ncbi:MAG: hypothetical protein Kow0026_21170 [Oricola sp.]
MSASTVKVVTTLNLSAAVADDAATDSAAAARAMAMRLANICVSVIGFPKCISERIAFVKPVASDSQEDANWARPPLPARLFPLADEVPPDRPIGRKAPHAGGAGGAQSPIG